MEIRKAYDDDVTALFDTDPIAAHEEKRRAYIRKQVREGTAHVAILDGIVAGYVVLEHSFFERGFISMLKVGQAHRRRGVGSALIRHVEGLCESKRIFTSTNRSNLRMQSLLRKLAYKHSGTVEDLDPDDPELFLASR
ncbi:MAG: GNAT family N-acetyltransferase [Myxococcota bacterium]